MSMNQFQENLRKYREKAGYTQAKDFAAAIGVKYTTYIAYENQGREPKYDTLIKIAAALHVSIDELLGYEVDELEQAYDLMRKSGVEFLPLEHDTKIIIDPDKVPIPPVMAQAYGQSKKTFLAYNEGIIHWYKMAKERASLAVTSAYKELLIQTFLNFLSAFPVIYPNTAHTENKEKD